MVMITSASQQRGQVLSFPGVSGFTPGLDCRSRGECLIFGESRVSSAMIERRRRVGIDSAGDLFNASVVRFRLLRTVTGLRSIRDDSCSVVDSRAWFNELKSGCARLWRRD